MDWHQLTPQERAYFVVSAVLTAAIMALFFYVVTLLFTLHPGAA